MSSSKKKKLTTECVACGCFVLAKDFEKHKAKCGLAPASSDVQILKPNEMLVALEQCVERWESYVAPEIFGWLKNNSILMHPEIMSLLGICPRHPCLLQRTNVKRVVVVWPCELVSQMRICVGSKMSDGLVQILPFRDFIDTNIICLKPVSPRQPYYLTDHFKEYVTAFLSSSYLHDGGVVEIPFYGTVCKFAVQMSLESQLRQMTMSDGRFAAIKVAPKCSVSLLDCDTNSLAASTLSFQCFGGGEKAKDDLMKHLIAPIKNSLRAPSVILNGISGTGKSLILKILGAELGSKCVFFQLADDFEDQCELLKSRDEPCAFVIDDFDRRTNSSTSASPEKLSRFIDENPNVSVVLALRNVEELDLSLRRRFALEIELPVPSLFERVQILEILLQQNKGIDSQLVREIAEQTHGFTGSDLRCLCTLAAVDAPDKDGIPTSVRLHEARKQVRPTGIREIVLEVPNVRWEDIGGNNALKEEIQQAVIWPQKYPEVFARFNIPAPSGILLYGPPGCSKTLVARALASQSKLNFLAVKGPELFSKWVGESERAVRELFRRARQVAPAILFFDEIDAVAVSRGEKSGSGVGDRVLAQLLTELDGLEKKSGVVVLAATNRPDVLDSALLRPGRLDKAIYVPLPDSDTRRSILKLHLNYAKLHSDVEVEELVRLTEGYSGAEVVAVYRNAALIALRENPTTEFLQWKHFLESLKTIVPRTEKRLMNAYEEFRKGYAL